MYIIFVLISILYSTIGYRNVDVSVSESYLLIVKKYIY